MNLNSKWQKWGGILFIIIMPTIMQILFAKLGFNPTDDGFILAGARRILEGQIPHLDFISIRTVGSYYLYAPFVYFGGDYTFWIARYFVLFEFACIIWAWILIISNSLSVFKYMGTKLVIAIIAFVFTVNYFPIMPWHTVDALFFASLGIYFIATSLNSWSEYLGFLLLGLTPLFRQNFIFLLPAALLVYKDWKNPKTWVIFLPGIVYIVYFAINNALIDAYIQINSYSSSTLQLGFFNYITSIVFLTSILIGFLVIHYLSKNHNQKLNQKRGLLISIFTILILSAFSIAFTGTFYLNITSKVIFGLSIGILLAVFYKERRKSYTSNVIMLIVIAWCTSLSVGYDNTTLASGPLIICIIGYLIHLNRNQQIGNNEPHKKLCTGFIMLLLVISLASFGWARENHIYRDSPAEYLNYNLGQFQGMKLIETNQNTYLYLKDLQTAQNIVKNSGKQYAIIPDNPFIWVKSPQPDPLSIDWPQDTELSNLKVYNGVIRDLENHKGKIVVIVQKYEASTLDGGFVPLNEYKIVDYVKCHFTKIGETKYFELYQ
jgi:hypothetical protein